MVGKIVFVRRSVLMAAQRLEALSDSGKAADPLDLAEYKIEDCRAAGDDAGLRFWRSVWTHMMRTRQGTFCLQVIDDGDEEKAGYLSPVTPARVAEPVSHS